MACSLNGLILFVHQPLPEPVQSVNPETYFNSNILLHKIKIEIIIHKTLAILCRPEYA